jgi:hypothetical protein
MLRAPTLAIVTLGLLASCYRLSPDEAHVIGTWQWSTIDAFGQITFTRNHRVSTCFTQTEGGPCDTESILHGTWRVEDENVLYTLDYSRFQAEDLRNRKDEAIPLRWFRAGAAPRDESNFRRAR